ncbi:DNA topoisomerase IV, alpha subunit [Ceratobasidium sp. AG-I]|nr:DNA topoisomerase IV, alpha subunit [Ceratobasidium sp. AG-I]
MSHRALKENVPITKRDIFYTDVGLFEKQSVVDTLVDDLAATWGLRRGDLNIRASLKGLFCGSSLQLFLNNGDVIRGLDCDETLIPVGESISRIHVDEELRWVLVVEKEAVFQTLRQLGFTSKYGDTGPGIIITGKGYPDLATRQLVSIFSADLPPESVLFLPYSSLTKFDQYFTIAHSIPILILVDADAHGLEIVTTYKFGSRAMTHENDLLVAPRLEWIGVRHDDLVGLGVDLSRMLKLTARDRQKAECMLDNPNLEEDMRLELETMLNTGYKAEIEILSAPRTSGPYHTGGPHALAAYVHGKILTSIQALGSNTADWIKDEQDMDYATIKVEEDQSANVENVDIIKLESSPSPLW